MSPIMSCESFWASLRHIGSHIFTQSSHLFKGYAMANSAGTAIGNQEYPRSHEGAQTGPAGFF